MTRILLFEPGYQRIKDRLPALGADDVLLLMDPDGTIRLDGKEVAVDDARPEVGWASVDLFRSRAGRDYFIALLKSPQLTWVQSSAAGFENPMFGQLVQKGARLTNNHSQAVGMSEYVLWGVLDYLQQGALRRTDQAAHAWRPTPFVEVSGSRWLVIGFGAIGQAVARRARAFDAHITGVRRTPGPQEHADAMATPDQIHDLLPASDVVVLSSPLNAQTANMVDTAFLSRMKPGSVLVNVGRGGLVDEAALRTALDKGVPAHAVLDVFQTEPLPEDSPFWDHPRVTLTPHSSAMGSGLAARSDALFVENLHRYLAGKPLLNQVEPAEVLGRLGRLAQKDDVQVQLAADALAEIPGGHRAGPEAVLVHRLQELHPDRLALIDRLNGNLRLKHGQLVKDTARAFKIANSPPCVSIFRKTVSALVMKSTISRPAAPLQLPRTKPPQVPGSFRTPFRLARRASSCRCG